MKATAIGMAGFLLIMMALAVWQGEGTFKGSVAKI